MKLDLKRSWLVLPAALIAVSQGVAADASGKEQGIEVKAQQLPQALMDFSEQTGLQIAYLASRAEGKASKGTQGRDEPAAALSDILEGTRLAYQFVNPRTVAIGPERASPRAASGPGPQPVLLAQQPARGGSLDEEPDAEGDAAAAAEDDALELGDQIVTGTRLLRASWETPGQVIVFSAEDLLNTGEPTLERALRQLPQNINGTTEFGGAGLYSPDDAPADSRRLLGTANINGSSTVNLRGLGESATLILVNGKRAGESGLLGGFTDISEFPVSMIDRVEIQLDGASAVYGSDAIGGVVNVILKKDFDLTRVSLRRTARTGGGLTEDNATASYSFSWDGGYATFSWDGYRASDQDVSTTSLLGLSVRPYGYPGTVRSRFGTAFNPSFSPFFGSQISPALTQAAIDAGLIEADETVRLVQLPAGQDGTGLSLDDVSSWNVNAFRTNEGRMEEISVAPKSNRNTLRAYASHEFGGIEASGGLTWAARRTGSRSGAAQGVTTFPVPAANPYNPFGVFVNVDMDASGFFGTKEVNGKRDSVTADLDFSGTLGGGWNWELRSRYSQRDVVSESINHVNRPALVALAMSDDPSQALNVFGDSLLTDGNNAAILAAANFQVPYDRNDSVNQIASSELIVRRDWIRLPGGAVRSVFGAEWRRNSLDMSYGNTQWAAAVISRNSPIGFALGDDSPSAEKARRRLRAAFAELFVPLFSEANAAAGLRDLNITLSGRHESTAGSSSASADLGSRYSSNVWSAGIVWRPAEAVAVRFNKSTGFRAPDISSALLSARATSEKIRDSRGCTGFFCGVSVPITRIVGGAPGLRPEESTSISSGIEVRPPFVPGLALRASYYDTLYRDRIAVQCTIPAFSLSNMSLSGSCGYTFTLDADGNVVSQDLRATNIQLLDTSGWDYALEWRFDAGGHALGFSASMTEVKEYIEDINIFDGMPAVDRVGTLHPANRFSGSLFWERWGWRVSLTAYTSSGVRYSDFYRDASEFPAEQIDFMAKTDPALVANLRGSVDIGEFWAAAPPLLESTRLSFGINNVGKAYDKVKLDPPIDQGHTGAIRNSFDARGQLYYLEVSKEF